MSTQRWELLPERIQNLYVKHVQMHKNFQAENRAQEIQMAGAEAMAEQVSGPMDPSMMGQPPGQQRQGPSPQPPTPTGGGPEFNINDPVPKGGQPSIEDQISAITGTA